MALRSLEAALAHIDDHPLLTRAFIRLLIGQAGFGYAFSSFFLVPKYLAAEFGTGLAAIGSLIAALGIVVSGTLSARRERRPINRVAPGHIP